MHLRGVTFAAVSVGWREVLIPDYDADAFAADLERIRLSARDALSDDDRRHRNKIERWGRACTVLGYGTAWIAPNPISALLISQGRLTRWAMIGHHTSHKGYDRVPGMPASQISRGFAQGWRRWMDWLDWIDPAAWHYEHDKLHHYRLGETADPDLLEHNLQWLRENHWPKGVKWAVIAFFMCTWKFSYYAPNTLRALLKEDRSLLGMFALPTFWRRCLLPVLLVHYLLIPLLFVPLGAWAAFSVLANSLLGELFTNLHSFLIIVTNHAGEDIHRFSGKLEDRAEFYRRQVVGSTNFRTGGDLNDFLHGWLNYQIEHHLFPDLPMRQYPLIQPQVRAVCERYGVPYVQESVWVRLRKTVAIAVGDASMIHEPAPATT